MDKSTSFIKLEWNKVCNLSAETIDSIEKERERRDRAFIKKHMDNSNNFCINKFFARLGLRKDWTYEEMKKYFDDGNLTLSQKFSYPSDYGWGDLEIALKLLKTCREQKDFYLSIEDYHAICPKKQK